MESHIEQLGAEAGLQWTEEPMGPVPSERWGYTVSVSQLPQEWGCVCSESLPPFHAQSTLTCVCSKPIPSDDTYLEDQVKKEQSFYLSDDRSFDGPDLVTPGASRLLGVFQAS